MNKMLLLFLLTGLAAGCVPERTVVKTPRYRVDSPGLRQENKPAGLERRVVIYNARIKILVDNADTLNRQLDDISQRYEGYVVTVGDKNSTIRVAASRLDDALASIAACGKIKSKVVSGEDVTDAYKDYGIRLENATRARQRYLELLEKAATVEETLKVEKELERLNGEIDLLKGKVERLTHLVEFSTIDLVIEERQKKGILGYVGVGLYKGVKWLFVRG